MLEWLIKQPSCSEVTLIETTVSPDNPSSESFFGKFAGINNSEIIKSPFLDARQFGGAEHEDEILFQIKL